MAAQARLKNEFTENEKYHNLMSRLICNNCNAQVKQVYTFGNSGHSAMLHFGFMCCWWWWWWVRVLTSLQQYYSLIGTMEGWTWRALCSEVSFRFGKNLASSGIWTSGPKSGTLTAQPRRCFRFMCKQWKINASNIRVVFCFHRWKKTLTIAEIKCIKTCFVWTWNQTLCHHDLRSGSCQYLQVWCSNCFCSAYQGCKESAKFWPFNSVYNMHIGN